MVQEVMQFMPNEVLSDRYCLYGCEDGDTMESIFVYREFKREEEKIFSRVLKEWKNTWGKYHQEGAWEEWKTEQCLCFLKDMTMWRREFQTFGTEF